MMTPRDQQLDGLATALNDALDKITAAGTALHSGDHEPADLANAIRGIGQGLLDASERAMDAGAPPGPDPQTSAHAARMTQTQSRAEQKAKARASAYDAFNERNRNAKGRPAVKWAPDMSAEIAKRKLSGAPAKIAKGVWPEDLSADLAARRRAVRP